MAGASAVKSPTVIIPVDVESALTHDECVALAELADGKTTLELGAWRGRSTICMAQTARQLVSVDWHYGDAHAGNLPTLGDYWANLHRYGLANRVVTVVGRFEQALPLLAAEAFEFVFLDGFHSYEQVRADIELLRPLAHRDATLAFHDYLGAGSSHGGPGFGVIQAVQETFGTPDRLVDTLAIFD
jgi:predicted O-methyltransferase YrrM